MPRLSAEATAHYNSELINGPRDAHLIVFESMLGRQFSDGPRAIYEELLRQRVPATALWSVDGSAASIPTDLPTIVRGSTEWYKTMARARVWVENQNFVPNLRKPPGTVYVQTWHGTPLKTLGLNTTTLANADEQQREKHRRSVARWDLVPVPSEYFVETVVRAHGSDADCLPIGSPRNDRLVRNEADDRRVVRAGFGMDEHTKVALFAPTRIGPQVERQRAWSSIQGPGAGWVHLVRGHYTDAKDGVDVLHAGAVDVSHVPDMADLLLAADVLVTDYSSSMYDYALRDLPMIIFQPDQQAYAEERGTYYDITSFPPGPLVADTAGLAELIDGIDDWSPQWAARRAEYRARFGEYEQGTSAEQLVTEHIRPALGL